SAAKSLGGVAGLVAGLPDDAFFPATKDHPDLRLHWDNADDGPNSRIMKSGDDLTVNTPVSKYQQVQIYGYSTGGTSALDITLLYQGTAIDVRSVTFPDWGDFGSLSFFVLVEGLNVASKGMISPNREVAVVGTNLNPSPQNLTGVEITAKGPGTFVLLGM